MSSKEKETPTERENFKSKYRTPSDARRRMSLWVGLGLIIIILFVVVVIPCPSASQYFVFRIIIALAAAGLASIIPGILNVNLGNGITSTGATAIFVVIYFFDPASTIGEDKCSSRPFTFTVFVHGKNGLSEKLLKGAGEVCLYLNSKPDKVKIDDDGKAVFTELSPTFLNREIRILVEHPQPYQSINPDSLYLLQRDGVVYISAELKGMDKIFGEVTDFKTGEFLDSVRVSVLDVEAYTNKNGWFELIIPADKQAKFQRVSFDKKGFGRELYDSVPVHIKQQFSVTMKQTSQ